MARVVDGGNLRTGLIWSWETRIGHFYAFSLQRNLAPLVLSWKLPVGVPPLTELKCLSYPCTAPLVWPFEVQKCRVLLFLSNAIV